MAFEKITAPAAGSDVHKDKAQEFAANMGWSVNTETGEIVPGEGGEVIAKDYTELQKKLKDILFLVDGELHMDAVPKDADVADLIRKQP